MLVDRCDGEAIQTRTTANHQSRAERPVPRRSRPDALASLAHIGVPFHHDESRPRAGREIAKPQARHGRNPERSVMNHKRNRCDVCATVCPRGSENAIRMSLKQRVQFVASERISLGPRITEVRRCRLIARTLDREQFFYIHQARINRSAVAGDLILAWASVRECPPSGARPASATDERATSPALR